METTLITASSKTPWTLVALAAVGALTGTTACVLGYRQGKRLTRAEERLDTQGQAMEEVRALTSAVNTLVNNKPGRSAAKRKPSAKARKSTSA